LERGLKPLPNGCLGIIIKINLTTNYQLLLNCNKVHRAQCTYRNPPNAIITAIMCQMNTPNAPWKP
jgi:hypothetical protein